MQPGLDDGILKGKLYTRPFPCGICGQRAFGIRLTHAQLPQGINWRGTMLSALVEHASQKVGIGCGCYAKVHRQVAHIAHSRRIDETTQSPQWIDLRAATPPVR